MPPNYSNPVNHKEVQNSSNDQENTCVLKPLNCKDYFHITIKLFLTKIFKILPTLIFSLFGFQTMIFFLGKGTAWTEF